MKSAAKKAPVVSIPKSPLRASDAKEFLTKYKEAWETRNPELAAGLFTRDVQFKPDPFSEPIVGREAVHDYWKVTTRNMQDIQFTIRNLVHSGYFVIAEWSCSYADGASGQRKEIAGAFVADFYGKQVRAFRTYAHNREKAA
jgi:ketosteroid isomerase-like protein